MDFSKAQLWYRRINEELDAQKASEGPYNSARVEYLAVLAAGAATLAAGIG